MNETKIKPLEECNEMEIFVLHYGLTYWSWKLSHDWYDGRINMDSRSFNEDKKHIEEEIMKVIKQLKRFGINPITDGITFYKSLPNEIKPLFNEKDYPFERKCGSEEYKKWVDRGNNWWNKLTDKQIQEFNTLSRENKDTIWFYNSYMKRD